MNYTPIKTNILKSLLACLAIIATLGLVVATDGADAAPSGKFQYTDTWTGQPTGQFSGPSDTDVATNGYVYVADANNNRIQVFDQNGNYKFQFGTYGNANGSFKSPGGVTVYGGNVYVADSGNNRIQIFNLSGEYLTKFGTQGTGNGQFNSPTDVAATGGYLFVADSQNNRIQSFSAATNTYISQFGSNGTGDGQFQAPQGIAATSEYSDSICSGGGTRVRVYVADTFNNRIQRFQGQCALGVPSPTYSGQWAASAWPRKVQAVDSTNYNSNIYATKLVTNQVTEYTPAGVAGASWGTAGNGDGQFRNPNGVGIDTATSRVFVADGSNNRVQRFSLTGTFQLKWGVAQNGNGEFSAPADVARDSSGNIFVVDQNNDRIEKFNSSGRFLLAFGSTGTGNGQFNGPTGIAISSTDQVFVADRGNNRIQLFDTSGAYVNQFGSYGSGNGQFVNPSDVALVSTLIYVVDQGNSRVQYFTAPGTYAGQWGTSGSGNSQFTFARSATIGGSYIYVTDATRIQQFNLFGTFTNSIAVTNTPTGISWKDNLISVATSDAGVLRVYRATPGSALTNPHQFCSNGSGASETSGPLGIDMYPGGTYDSGPDEYNNVRVLVADTGNNRVKRLLLSGDHDCTSEGVLGNSDLAGTQYATIAPNGDIYAGDSNNNRVVRFDSSGNVLTRWGLGGGPDGFGGVVRGVAAASDSSVYVADGTAIRHFSSTGALSDSLATTQTQDIAAGSGGLVYRSTGTAITIYNSALVQQSTFGSSGSGNGQFVAGSGLGVTPGGDLLVADLGNNRIQRFSSSGSYISQMSTPSPIDVYWGPDGRIYVTGNDSQIRVYSSYGGTLTDQFGSLGPNIGQFNLPRGIVVNSNSRIFISDVNNNRLQLYDWLPSRVQYSSEATDYAGNQVNVPTLDSTTVEGGF